MTRFSHRFSRTFFASRPWPKGQGRSFAFRGDASHDLRRAEKISGGQRRSRAAPGPRSTAGRLRGWSLPAINAPSQITNTFAGYQTAELSDSPQASVMPPVPDVPSNRLRRSRSGRRELVAPYTDRADLGP